MYMYFIIYALHLIFFFLKKNCGHKQYSESLIMVKIEDKLLSRDIIFYYTFFFVQKKAHFAFGFNVALDNLTQCLYSFFY